MKCGECKNQKFFSADDAAYWSHLSGGHVMGVYSMLPDSTCWFLAVDFDKATWTEDVRAFIATCRKLDLPFLVERSRSGKGAHVWFFFSAPVAAWSARKLGSYVLTQTMAARHELSMDSYDRLFPSQDHMPRGGFGSLIALPLQKEARKLGNTELLDDDLVPFPGELQWEVLAAVRRIDPAAVERIVADAAREGGVLGVEPRRLTRTRLPGWSQRSASSSWCGSLARCRAEYRRCSRNGCSSRPRACHLRSSTSSSARPRSRTPSFTRSKPCACRPRGHLA